MSSLFGTATPADALELASTPWLDAGEVLPVAATKSAVTPASSQSWTMAQWAERIGDGGFGSQSEAMFAVATIFACVRVIAEDVAKLPRHLLRSALVGNRQTTRKATDHPLYDVLTAHPNDWMTGQELVEYMIGQAALRGQSFSRLTRRNNDPSGDVLEILPLMPGTCRRMQDEAWGVRYEISGYAAGVETVTPEFIWTVNGPMTSTTAGADQRSMARRAADLAAKLEDAQIRFHASDARPSGVLTTKGQLQPNQRDAIRAAWQAAYGPGGTGGTAVLDTDFEFKPISISAADSQVIENRAFQTEEICRIFRVHPWAIMRQVSSQSYASIEQTGLAHIQHTIQPWVTRLEQTVQRDIIGRGSDLYLKCNINALARSTFADRVNGYKTASTVYMTPNEIRELEDMDPIDIPAMDLVQLPANNTGLAQAQPSPPAPVKPPRSPSATGDQQ